MSYGQPPHNQYGGPPQQGGWGQPPPQQQWGGHAPPQGPPPNWQGGPPQGNYGPPQQQWNAPPGPPPGQQWNAPPGPPPGQQQWGPPQGPPPGHQQQQWGPPQGPPPGHQQQQFAPPQGPPQGGFGGPGGAGQPSFGYVPGQLAQGWNAVPDANALRAAMKGFGTNEKELIRILTPLDPLQVNSVKQAFSQQHKGRDLEKDVKSETSRYFQEGLLAIIRGPLQQDAYGVNDAIAGAGTNEAMLNDVVMGRSNADLRAIKQVYQQKYGRRMEDHVAGDLSMKTKDLFNMVLAANRAEENAPVQQQQVERDVDELNRALTSRNEQIAVCNIICLRSDGQLRAIAHAFEQKYRRPLRTAMEKKFDGHMEDALLLALDRALDRAMCDAVQLEAAMAGMGTKDKLLVNRIVRAHWDKGHKDQVKRAYQHRYKRDLIARVQGETSGDYRDLMVALLR